MRSLWLQVADAMRNLWCGVRQWSGDSAYETYLACAKRQRATKPLSPTEFYIEQLNRKYSRPNRCC
jgi:uncharacterized short protein YbdD (DUF466 family)